MQSEADHSDESDIRPKINAGVESNIVEETEWAIDGIKEGIADM